MLLVYATTRAAIDGWGAPTTLALFAGAAALVLAFVVVELRSPSPLLPLRIFRLRTLVGANATMAIFGGVVFAEFFTLTLYLQEVLDYSAVESGVAFSAFAISVVISSNIAQFAVGRFGVRPTLTAGLLASAVSVAWLTRLPVDGHYFWDLFPAFVLGGTAMGLSFVPLTIASLSGVERADAGVASGLVNTSRQIGGAVGLAAASAVAATAAEQLRRRASWRCAVGGARPRPAGRPLRPHGVAARRRADRRRVVRPAPAGRRPDSRREALVFEEAA